MTIKKCDFCGSSDYSVDTRVLPAYILTSDTLKRSIDEDSTNVEVDICDECLRKVSNIRIVDGHPKFMLNPWLKDEEK